MRCGGGQTTVWPGESVSVALGFPNGLDSQWH